MNFGRHTTWNNLPDIVVFAWENGVNGEILRWIRIGFAKCNECNGRQEVSPPVREFHKCFDLATSLHGQLSLVGAQNSSKVNIQTSFPSKLMFTNLLRITSRKHSTKLDIEIMKAGQIFGPQQPPFRDRATKGITNPIRQCLYTIVQIGCYAVVYAGDKQEYIWIFHLHADACVDVKDPATCKVLWMSSSHACALLGLSRAGPPLEGRGSRNLRTLSYALGPSIAH